MTRKLVLISGLALLAIAVAGLVWTRAVRSLGVDTSADAEAIRETILRARRITIEAEYTFDTSEFDTVFVNDPRGGEITDEALARIQVIRQDPTIQKDQVGLLDYEKVAIENLKREYEKFIAELRGREAAGTLHEGDRAVLDIVTNGWPTPESTDVNAAATATQACLSFIAEAMEPTPEPSAAYPLPEPPREGPVHKLEGDEPYPMPAWVAPTREISCPTPTPVPQSITNVPYQGADPSTIPPEEFDIEIHSIEIDDDIATAVLHKRAVTSEYTLVKIDGRWFIAGVRLLMYTP